MQGIKQEPKVNIPFKEHGQASQATTFRQLLRRGIIKKQEGRRKVKDMRPASVTGAVHQPSHHHGEEITTNHFNFL
jgi:hypothetical protein